MSPRRCSAWSSSSTARSSARGCTRPRRASTRPRSTERLVGDQVLAPGWTSYQHRLRYQTYDVTDLLAEGANAIGIQLADGWFIGYLGFGGKRNIYGDRPGAIAQLEVEHPDGTRTVISSDASWRSTLGPLTRADIYQGETFDARKELAGLVRGRLR